MLRKRGVSEKDVINRVVCPHEIAIAPFQMRESLVQLVGRLNVFLEQVLVYRAGKKLVNLRRILEEEPPERLDLLFRHPIEGILAL